jgi:DNA transformation protein and related proteins
MNSSSKRSAAVTAALDSLTGLGPKSTAMLAAVGVKSVTDLRKRGAAKAFFEVRAAGLRPSLNLLWALEGALTAMPWHKVARTERTRLLFEVEDLKAISAGGNRSGSGQ